MKQKPIDLQKCFFCDKIVFSDGTLYSKENFKDLQKVIGTIPESFGGKIGNKIVCKLCANDIYDIVNYETEE